MLKTVITYEEIKKLAEAKKPIHIDCPYCKAQYLPGEIYMPAAIVGQPVEVVKDSYGKIIYVDYKKVDRMPNTSETFVCEYCGQPFDIEAGYITYKVSKTDQEKNFKQDYVPLLD